jgi:hypothetical protein
MSQGVGTAAIDFQGVSPIGGSSTRHERDMEGAFANRAALAKAVPWSVEGWRATSSSLSAARPRTRNRSREMTGCAIAMITSGVIAVIELLANALV